MIVLYTIRLPPGDVENVTPVGVRTTKGSLIKTAPTVTDVYKQPTSGLPSGHGIQDSDVKIIIIAVVFSLIGVLSIISLSYCIFRLVLRSEKRVETAVSRYTSETGDKIINAMELGNKLVVGIVNEMHNEILSQGTEKDESTSRSGTPV